MVTINKSNKEVVFNPEYYVMKHMSRYVQSGASLLTVSDNSDLLAFKNPDNSIVLVLANTTATDKQQILKISDKYIDVVVKAKSFNTIIL